MPRLNTKSRASLPFRWILFSGFGLCMGIALALSIADPIENLVGMMLVTPVILVVAGIVFGGTQWLSLWNSHRIGRTWVVATGFSLGISMTLGIVIVEVVGRMITGESMRLFDSTPIERTISLFVIGSITGLAVGLSQWFVLRHHLRNTNWIILTAVAFSVGFPVGAFAAELMPGGLSSIFGFVIFVCVTGIIVGSATARYVQQLAINLTNSDAG